MSPLRVVSRRVLGLFNWRLSHPLLPASRYVSSLYDLQRSLGLLQHHMRFVRPLVPQVLAFLCFYVGLKNYQQSPASGSLVVICAACMFYDEIPEAERCSRAPLSAPSMRRGCSLREYEALVTSYQATYRRFVGVLTSVRSDYDGVLSGQLSRVKVAQVQARLTETLQELSDMMSDLSGLISQGFCADQPVVLAALRSASLNDIAVGRPVPTLESEALPVVTEVPVRDTEKKTICTGLASEDTKRSVLSLNSWYLADQFLKQRSVVSPVTGSRSFLVRSASEEL
ncbi:MAG: hypothetical protein VW378_04560 [bacterium]